MLRLLILALLITTPAFADKLCIKKKQAVKNEKVTLKKVLRTGTSCPSGYFEVLDTSIFQGPAGANGQNGSNGANGQNGTDGQDGMDSAWGDGSAGARVVSANEDLDDDNLQFTDFTINSGVTLTVPSGTIIRCTGTATINGTIQVETAGNSGDILPDNRSKNASQGLSTQPAGDGELGDSSSNRQGGYPSSALDSAIGRSIIRPPVLAGGAGGGGYSGNPAHGQGGGSIAIYCQGGITVNGTGLISAGGGYGGNCQGGGAGGVIILASAGTVDHSGPIRARGSTGGAFSAFCAQGGGGGGGLIHILAQTISGNDANLSAAGGSAVTGAQGAGTVSSGTRSGGGAGGSLFGAGGQGSLVATNGATLGASVGSAGVIIKRQGFNPAGML